MGALVRTAALAAALSILLAGAVNLLLLTIATAISGPIVVDIPGGRLSVGIFEIVAVTVQTSIVGAIGSAILARWPWGMRVVVIAGALVTLVSLLAVGTANTAAGAIALGVMHAVTGFTIVAVNVALHSRRARALRPAR